MATGLAAIAGCKGPSSSVSTACAASSSAIGDSFRFSAREGRCNDLWGAEASITPLGVAGLPVPKLFLLEMKVLKLLVDLLMQKEMDLLLGKDLEFLFETLKCSKKECRIYAEIVGYGVAVTLITLLHHLQEGGGTSIKWHESISCEKVDYINAHGTSIS